MDKGKSELSNSGSDSTTSILPAKVDELSNLAESFRYIFRGCDRAYGVYGNIKPDDSRGDGKRKGTAITQRGQVTPSHWTDHLSGARGLGIIPICDDDTAVWGAIDVDVYADLDIARVAASIERMKLPLIPCRSKSGGVHIYLFAQSPVPAAQMQKALRSMAARLGFGSSEVFPKQTVISAEKGDLGSWINMPYFDAANTDRYALHPNGDRMTAAEFISTVTGKRVPASAFVQPPARGSAPAGQGHLADGPPCLQHLMELGFPPGTWNSGMFNLGVYCRKAYPDNWQDQLRQLNALNFPPDKWPASDLNPIIKSLSQKNYSYQCDQHPLVEHCDRTTCQLRRHGVGSAKSLPALSSLTKLNTTPPVWFVEVEGHRLELTTAQLLNPLAFQELCADHSIIVPVTNRAKWTEYLRPFVAGANEISVGDDGTGGDDSSSKGRFLELLDQFCTSRAQAHDRDGILTGRPYRDSGKAYFRLSGLMTYLARVNFKELKAREVVAALKQFGATNQQERINGRVTRVWCVQDSAQHAGLPMTDGSDAF